ncbi:MAG: serine/threonine protein kinase [Myxococcales bacterium]|nr:serine/threonine protein kinase [Myxococcales bacterium]
MAVEFGRYQLLKKIASGGMGQIFLARAAGERGFEKLLVIKRILPHLLEDEEFFTMFFDEARVSARLNHPNIVQIFDLGEVEGSHFLAMEYVPGEDLRRLDKLLRSMEQSIPLGLACRIIADAAAGLDYAHKARDSQGQPLGIVHRDVSPQNILVGFDGGVKLIDFGVAKAAGRGQQTATGILKGKYAYMSPEQVDGLEIDHRSDIFALGIVFWEILTAKRLFKGESDLTTMRLVKDCSVPPPSRVSSELPPAIDEIILKALARNRDQRYPDAMAFRLAIEEFSLEQKQPSSSAHLVAFLRELYADRIAEEADVASMDQLQPDEQLDPTGTPSRSSTMRVDRAAPKASAKPGGTVSLSPAHRRRLPWALIAVAVVLAVGAGLALPRLLPAKPSTEPMPPASALPPPPSPNPPASVSEPPRPPPPAPIAIKLLSEPLGAAVEIDGKPLGTTPLDYALDAAGGTRMALFTKEGFEPAQAAVSAQVAPELSVQLKRKPKGKKPLGIKTGR